MKLLFVSIFLLIFSIFCTTHEIDPLPFSKKAESMSRKRPAKSEVSMVETALSNEIREATTEIESRELLKKKSFHIA